MTRFVGALAITVGFAICACDSNGISGGGGNGTPDASVTSTGCLSDPDNPTGCTFWNCTNVPIQFGKKVHCVGQPGSGAGTSGGYDCNAGAGTQKCPPSQGPTFHCESVGGQLTCDSSPDCQGGAFPSGDHCAACTAQTCAMAQCAGSGPCGSGSIGGGTAGPCTVEGFMDDVSGLCQMCTESTCGEPGCIQATVCRGCPVNQFNDGTGCRDCTPTDCFHAQCLSTPACAPPPGGASVCRAGYTPVMPNPATLTCCAPGSNCYAPGCQKCVPGAIRYCDFPLACRWGTRTCDAAGNWGACSETGVPNPPGCTSVAYDPACCVAAGACCEELGYNGGALSGNCSQQCRVM